MTKPFNNLFFRFTLFIIAIAAVHFLLLKNTLPVIYSNTQPWKIYAFLVPIEFLGLWLIYARYQRSETSALNNFMFLLIIKMLGSLFFLAPWLFYQTNYTRPFVAQFFAVFFPILLAEIIFLVKMLSTPSQKNKKN